MPFPEESVEGETHHFHPKEILKNNTLGILPGILGSTVTPPKFNSEFAHETWWD